jgi:hypothetical protein
MQGPEPIKESSGITWMSSHQPGQDELLKESVDFEDKEKVAIDAIQRMQIRVNVIGKPHEVRKLPWWHNIAKKIFTWLKKALSRWEAYMDSYESCDEMPGRLYRHALGAAAWAKLAHKEILPGMWAELEKLYLDMLKAEDSKLRRVQAEWDSTWSTIRNAMRFKIECDIDGAKEEILTQVPSEKESQQTEEEEVPQA